MCVSLPSSNIFFHFNFLPFPMWHTPPRELQVLWRPQRLVDLQSSSFPFPHTAITHCGQEVIFSSSVLSHIKRKCTQTSFTYRSCSTQCRCTDCYTAWYCTRYGSLQERQVVSRLLRTCKSILSLICIHSRRFY